MGSRLTFMKVCFSVFMLVWSNEVHGQGTFDVTKYGADPSGMQDSSKAFTDAWNDACKAGGTMVVPGRTFLVSKVYLEGQQCQGAVTVDVYGTIKATKDIGFEAWFTFHNIPKGLNIRGSGTFDGNGDAVLWEKSNGNAPRSIQLDGVKSGNIEGITSLNSKGYHIGVHKCDTITIKGMHISAPGSSKNTDGIHTSRSSNVHIEGFDIATGDDCVSIGEGSTNINVTNVNCGPGHGFSIGSIGNKGDQDVRGVRIIGCTVSGTENGARIKTTPSPVKVTVDDVTFEGLTVKNAENGIIIDQNYYNGNSNVQISNVKYIGVQGSSSKEIAVDIRCSATTPCKGIQMTNINVSFNGGQSKSQCANAEISFSGTQNPPKCW